MRRFALFALAALAALPAQAQAPAYTPGPENVALPAAYQTGSSAMPRSTRLTARSSATYM